jgi:hypothetical protein
MGPRLREDDGFKCNDVNYLRLIYGLFTAYLRLIYGLFTAYLPIIYRFFTHYFPAPIAVLAATTGSCTELAPSGPCMIDTVAF